MVFLDKMAGWPAGGRAGGLGQDVTGKKGLCDLLVVVKPNDTLLFPKLHLLPTKAKKAMSFITRARLGVNF